jgi:glycosyl transferase family 1
MLRRDLATTNVRAYTKSLTNAWNVELPERGGVMQGKTLLLSQRSVSTLVAYCIGYEFEDTFANVTDSERIDTTDLPAIEFSRRAYKLARMALGSADMARRLAPYPRNRTLLNRDFDLFFPVFSHVYEVYALATIPNWRKRSKVAACFITEVWSDMLPKYLLELLADFDHIFIGCRNGVEEISRLTGRPCTYLPIAADVLRFAPTSPNEPRPIEVSYIGRRSQVTHQALLEGTKRQGHFYYYDTVAASGIDLKHRTFRVDAPHEHRRLLATLLKRSRFFFANRSYVNRPEFTAGRDEISSRFYEGAAAGTVMIGEAPRSEEFDRQFGWEDALIPVPFDSPDIDHILAELNADPERLRTISRSNVREVALRHDWVHRIQVVFDVLGLKPTDRMRARTQQLEQISAQFSG